MTFDLGWPWPPITIGGSRATPGESLVKIGAGVSEIWWWPWNDLWWSRLNSPANFKILPQVTFDLGRPWPRPPITIGGSRAISGAILVKIGAGVLEWLRNIHTPPHPVNYSKMYDFLWSQGGTHSGGTINAQFQSLFYKIYTDTILGVCKVKFKLNE